MMIPHSSLYVPGNRRLTNDVDQRSAKPLSVWGRVPPLGVIVLVDYETSTCNAVAGMTSFEQLVEPVHCVVLM